MSWSPTRRLLVGGTRLPRRIILLALGPLCLFHPLGPLDEVLFFYKWWTFVAALIVAVYLRATDERGGELRCGISLITLLFSSLLFYKVIIQITAHLPSS